MRLSPTCPMKPCAPSTSSALSVVPIPRLAVSAIASSWIFEQARSTADSRRATMSFGVTRLAPDFLAT